MKDDSEALVEFGMQKENTAEIITDDSNRVRCAENYIVSVVCIIRNVFGLPIVLVCLVLTIHFIIIPLANYSV